MDERVRCWNRMKYVLFLSALRGEIGDGRVSRFMESLLEAESDDIEYMEGRFWDEFGYSLWPDGRPNDRETNEWNLTGKW